MVHNVYKYIILYITGSSVIIGHRIYDLYPVTGVFKDLFL